MIWASQAYKIVCDESTVYLFKQPELLSEVDGKNITYNAKFRCLRAVLERHDVCWIDLFSAPYHAFCLFVIDKSVNQRFWVISNRQVTTEFWYDWSSTSGPIIEASLERRRNNFMQSSNVILGICLIW